MIKRGLYNGLTVYVNTANQRLSHPSQYAIVYQDGTQAFAPVNEVTFADAPPDAPALSHTEDVEAENARLRARVAELEDCVAGLEERVRTLQSEVNHREEKREKLAIARNRVKEEQAWIDDIGETGANYIGELDAALGDYHAAAETFFDLYDEA